jgi:hypothetical protein
MWYAVIAPLQVSSHSPPPPSLTTTFSSVTVSSSVEEEEEVVVLEVLLVVLLLDTAFVFLFFLLDWCCCWCCWCCFVFLLPCFGYHTRPTSNANCFWYACRCGRWTGFSTAGGGTLRRGILSYRARANHNSNDHNDHRTHPAPRVTPHAPPSGGTTGQRALSFPARAPRARGNEMLLGTAHCARNYRTRLPPQPRSC